MASMPQRAGASCDSMAVTLLQEKIPLSNAPRSTAASSARIAASSAGPLASLSISLSSEAALAVARLSLACSECASRRRLRRRRGPTRRKSVQPDSSRPAGQSRQSRQSRQIRQIRQSRQSRHSRHSRHSRQSRQNKCEPLAASCKS